MFYFPGKQVLYTVSVNDKEDGSTAGGKLDVANIFVKAEYVEGKDKAAMPQGHQIISGAIAGKNIMESSDCKTCHHATNKLIGPAHTDVAKKYEFTQANVLYLADKILKGGSGVWGQVPMTAHADISQANAEKMARYVLSLDGEKEH